MLKHYSRLLLMYSEQKAIAKSLRILLILLVLSTTASVLKAQTPDFFTQPAVPSGSGNTVPYYYGTSGTRAQTYYPSHVFSSILSPRFITAIYMVPTVSGNWTYANIEISVGQPNITGLTSGNYATGLKKVFTRTNHTITRVADQWLKFELDTLFYFDPSLPLVVEVNISHTSSTGSWTTQTNTPYITGTMRNYSASYNTSAPSSMSSDLINKLGLDLRSLSSNNAGITKLVSPLSFCSNTTQDIKVRLNNLGTNILNNVTINWSLDGIPQSSIYFNSPLDTFGGLTYPNDTTISLGTISFGGTPHLIKAWTELPNGVADTTNLDDSITVLIGPGLQGHYTVGGSSPDFTDLGSAINALKNFGVCDSVIFDIDPSTPPYTNNIQLFNINGASEINTIKFNGNGTSISSNISPVISFSGSKYITLDGFNITQTGTLGFGVQINGGSQYLTINNNIITAPAAATATTSAALVVAAGTATTTGNSAQYLTITNNVLQNGYYNMTLIGNTGYSNNYGHYIANNKFKDAYYYGINISHGDSIVFVNNEIERISRSTVSSTTYGIYLNGCRNTKVKENSIHHMQGSTLYPIYITTSVNTPGYETEVINNAIYNLGNTGTMYGIYGLGTLNGLNIYHNTIQHNHTTGAHRGVFFSVAPNNVNLKNNIISITGGGTKHAIYISTTSTSFVSNHNVLHLSGGGTNTIGYWTAARTTISDWRTNSGQDINSEIVDPLFKNILTGNLLPNEIAIDNIGTPVGVNSDINGLIRSTIKPDPGAFESFNMSPNNAGVATLVAPTNFCNGNHDIVIRIRNYGNNLISGVNIQWELNGVSQSPIYWSYPLDTIGGTLYPSDTAITLTNVLFTGKSQLLKAWTEMPNAIIDTMNANDTLTTSINPIMNGTYTIGGLGADFENIGEAVAALKMRGICGPVVFNNLLNDTSNYTSTITLENITGLTSTNTITFNGNGHTIMSSATPIIAFNGVSYITIDSFIITGNSSSYVGVGIHVGGASHHLTFNRNLVAVSTTSTTTTSNSAFMASGSLTTATTTGNNAQYLTITNNTFIGGYYQFTIIGNTNYADNYGHYIANNTFTDFYIYGPYFVHADTLTFINNDINRATLSTVTTLYGLYLSSSRYMKIENNRIHDCGSGSYSAYPIYLTNNVNSSGYETEFINNSIYNIQTTSTFYGIYSLTTAITNTNFYHNTIQHHVTSGSGVIRGAFFSVAVTNVNFKNNIISITGDGTGVKTGIYVSTTSTSFNSNHNVVHVSTTGTNTDNFGYWGALNPTKADWSNASNQDINSMDFDPGFNNVSTGNLTPLSVSIDNIGTPVGVLTDITGAARSTATPDAGAYEFSTAFICSGKPYAGEAISSVSYACSNQSFTIGITNDSVALGLKYNWLVSTTESGPYYASGDTVKNITVTQSYTNWYKLVVSCPASGMSDTTNAVKVRTTTNPLGGYYTIDQSQPESATNFTNFTDLLNELNCNGVFNPVIVNVISNGAIYNERLTFDSIPGASAINTITINGNGNIIRNGYSPIISFSKSSYITLDSLHIIGDSGYAGFGIHISNASHHLTLNRNLIDVGMNTTATTNAGIVASGSVGGATTAGNNAQYLTITNNTVVGGYYSIALSGQSSYLNNYMHEISNNKLQDFYIYGLYLLNADSVLVHNNDISRPTRNTISTFYGLYGSTIRNVKYLNNKIHDAGIGTYTAYPVYITGSENTLGYETEFINNAIYNIPTTGTIYGYYLLGTRNYMKFYHNTVSIDVTGGSGTIRGLFLSTAPNNHDFRNNIISITGEGTGTKHVVYVTTGSTSITSNHNVLFIDTTISTNYVGYITANCKSLADWQTAAMVDQNSVAFNPVFANLLIGNLTPLSPNCDNIGTNVGVTTDILGNLRSTTTPDVGAVEFTGIAGDIALTNATIKRADSCYSNYDTIFVTVQNSLGTTIDFSITPLYIYWSTNGPVNSTGLITVGSGTLAVGASATYFDNNVQRYLPGDYTTTVYIDYTAINVNTSNDTLTGVTSTVNPILQVTTKHYNVNSPTDSIIIQAISPLFPKQQVFISEVCHYKATPGIPTNGWPTYLLADDYIEITGVPYGNIDGYILEEWNNSGLINTHTFSSNTKFSPEGTMIVATGQLAGSVPMPNMYYYHTSYSSSYTHSSTTAMGYIIKTESGVIIDAVALGNITFPPASGVTNTDWSGATPAVSGSGITLTGIDNNTNTNWVAATATVPQTPNTLNNNVPLPTVNPVQNFYWLHGGNIISSLEIQHVGPWTVPGTYTYIAEYVSGCGTYYDTVYVHAGPGVPVKLTTFTANQNNNNVIVSWQTASEKNASHFEVFRSVDNNTWEKVGVVKAHGNTSSIRNYRILDKDAMNTSASTLLYKLKSVDVDGSFEWSNIATVSTKKLQNTISVYPNPFTQEISINALSDGYADVEIVSAQGLKLISTTVTVTNNNATINQLQDLKAGVYFVKVTQNGLSHIAKVVKH
jgi:hypothetical protein